MSNKRGRSKLCSGNQYIKSHEKQRVQNILVDLIESILRVLFSKPADQSCSEPGGQQLGKTALILGSCEIQEKNDDVRILESQQEI